MKKVIAYNVTDIKTNKVIKSYPEGKGYAAMNFADKKDSAYGAVRYIVVNVWSE